MRGGVPSPPHETREVPNRTSWSLRFVLDLELHPPDDTGDYRLVAVTDAPALLTASGVWIDRAAMLTLRLGTGGDEYVGAARVTGTVDGIAYSYDYGWTD